MINRAPHFLLLLPTLAVIVGACGGLETPVGAITGRIVGAATTGAYVYPLGRPDLKVDVQPDGSYRLEAVPIELRALVLYDGFPMPDGRAELVQVRLTGGTENRIPDRFGGAGGLMPIAGTVLAAAVPDGGATPWRPTFTLPATVHAGITPDTGGVREIWPLPAGQYDVGAVLTGFDAGRITVTVSAAMTSAAPVPLLIDAGATAPGCGSVPVTPACENGLVCEPADGRCYECTASDASNCSSGCDLDTHTCNAPAPAVSTWCSPCTSGSNDCASATLPGLYCRVSEDSTTGTGYCTNGCTSDSDCSAAGFKCDEGRCKALEGCNGWVQTMGAVCYSDSRCASYLAGGRCSGDHDGLPGTCTAPCAVDGDCAVGSVTSFVCAPVPGGEMPLGCVPG